MAERSYILKMDQPDYDEAPGFQKGPAMIFVIEIALAAGISLFAAWVLFDFLYDVKFMSDVSAFNDWVIKTVENKTILMYSSALVLLSLILVISVSCLVKTATGLFTVRSMEAPLAYNKFAISFIANLNGMIARLGPDEEVVAGLEADRYAFGGHRFITYFTYFSIIVCGLSLVISSLIYYDAGYYYSDRAAFAFIFAFPFFPLLFAKIYRPMKHYSMSLFAFTAFAMFVFISIRHEFIAFYREFAIAVLIYLSLHAIAFALYISRKNVDGCLLLTNKGLRIIDLRGTAASDVSGLFVPERITVSPAGDFESWTFHMSGGDPSPGLLTSGAKIDEFADLMRSSADLSPVIEKTDKRDSISHNFITGVSRLCLPLICILSGVIFLSETVAISAYLSAIPDITDNKSDAIRAARDGKIEKTCRAILELSPDDPCAVIKLFQCLDPGDKIEERYELLKRAVAYQGKRLIPVENTVSDFIDKNMETTRSAIALIKNGPRGWEPRGAGLAQFRTGMAKTVNFKYYDKRLTSAFGLATTDFFDAMNMSPDSPGPRLMLAWQFYSTSPTLISKIGEAGTAPKYLFVSFEKYEAEILSKKTPLDSHEASALLVAFKRVNEKLASATLFENNKDFKWFGRSIEGVLPKSARDRLLAGYLAARLDKKPVSGWDAVFREASKFKFMDKTPAAHGYGASASTTARYDEMYKLLFDPPQNTLEFMKAFPELSGCLSPGEFFKNFQWVSLPGMKDGDLARLLRSRYDITDMLSEKHRNIVRNLK